MKHTTAATANKAIREVAENTVKTLVAGDTLDQWVIVEVDRTYENEREFRGIVLALKVRKPRGKKISEIHVLWLDGKFVIDTRLVFPTL
jgi:hypothetical protein